MAWSDVRETFGLVLVLAGLIFVGVEIRQNNQLARGQARQTLSDQNQEWLLYLASDPAAFALYLKVWQTDEPVTEAEMERARLLLVASLRRVENVYLQFVEGLVDESALDAYGISVIRRQFETERFKTFWFDEDWRSTFDPAFVRFFETRAT